jgi:hypothetical protein
VSGFDANGDCSWPSCLDGREAALEMEQNTLEDARAMVFSRELTAEIKETNPKTLAVELEEREKQLADRQMRELAVAQKRLDDLQASRAGDAQQVWRFLGQTDDALALLDFSPVRTGFLAQEVGTVLPFLDSVGAKISRLEEASSNQLEVEGRILAQAVMEHMVLCFRSRDPQISLEPMLQGPAEELEEGTRAGVEEVARVVAERLERQHEDA